MKFTQNVGKKPINRNKVTAHNLYGSLPSYMRLTKCCVSFVFNCIYIYIYLTKFPTQLVIFC